MSNKSRGEIGIDLLGLNALNPYRVNNSAAREAMATTQIGQAPVVDGSSPRHIYTGIETEYAKYTFDIKIPCDATILRTIKKYRPSVGIDAIHHNPLTTIIYEDYYDPSKTVGVIQVPEFNSLHQDFGYRFVKNKEVWDRINDGAQIGKGEQLAVSPAVRKNGQYSVGMDAEAIFMSAPGTIEDGFIVSESFLERMTPSIYNTLVGNWGRKAFPLNLYGDDKTYKPFPDIGQRIRDDGVVFAVRDIDDDLGVAEMTPRALREIDPISDRPQYGKPGAIVVDVTAYLDSRLNPSFTPAGMDAQARKYYDAQAHYYQQLIEVYEHLQRRRGKALRITPEFNRLLVEAMLFLPTQENQRKLTRMYRLEQLDEWRVEVTYEYKMKTGDGNKFTDSHGGKGVVCKTVPDADMPVDENGNRADVIIYGNSTIKRMNMGRIYEQFINAASRDLTHRLRREFGLDEKLKPTKYQLATVKQNAELIGKAWKELIDYYGIVAPIQKNLLNDEDAERHVLTVLEDGIFLYVPPDNPVNNLEMLKELRESRFCPHYGPVTYRDNAGNMVTTKNPLLIGMIHMFMLEKTGEDWSSVASVKTNHFGVPSKLNNFDKQTSPGRQVGVRCLGESETRSYCSTVGPEATMELLDQSNSPESHAAVITSIITAPKPTAIKSVVNRRKRPFGSSRPVSFVNHFLTCRGMKLTYIPNDKQD